MNRKEATEIMNQDVTVTAWTAMNGTYTGKLVEVTNDKPWRGKVKITGVLSVAGFEASRGKYQRKGFREGDVIEVGNSSIKIASEEQRGITYQEAIEKEIAILEGFKVGNKDAWWLPKAIEWYKNQLNKESDNE